MFSFELRPGPPSTTSPFIFDGTSISTSTSSSPPTHGGRQRSFATLPGKGVLSLDMQVGERSIQIYMLKEMLEADGELWKRTQECAIMPWVEWGQEGCRMIEAPSRRHW